MTNSGPDTKKSGAPITGIDKLSCKIFGSVILSPFEKVSLTEASLTLNST